MKAFKNFIITMILVLGCVCTTGCGVDDATNAAHSAKEQVTTTAHNAKETVDWWTRSTDHQSWTNPNGTRIEISERRKEGDFEIKIVYKTENLTPYGEEAYTEEPTVVMYVDQISEELMDRLQNE